MAYPLFLVDAFADRPFVGNPAAVCLLEEEAATDWMQDVACELNLSETAFLVPGLDSFGLRWFTPKFEVELCGHATLASAHVLWTTGTVPDDRPLVFDTRSGLLGAERRGEWIVLDFPVDSPIECDPPPGLRRSLGAEPVWFGRGKNYEFAEVGSETELRSLCPDFERLRRVVPVGVCVTARSESADYDFVSRFFAPNAGIDEDPATGSAHCMLAPYWAGRVGKPAMTAFQASSRGAYLRVRLGEDRVEIEGQATTVVRGTLC